MLLCSKSLVMFISKTLDSHTSESTLEWVLVVNSLLTASFKSISNISIKGQSLVYLCIVGKVCGGTQLSPVLLEEQTDLNYSLLKNNMKGIIRKNLKQAVLDTEMKSRGKNGTSYAERSITLMNN